VLANFVRASYCKCNLGGMPFHVKLCATDFDNDDEFQSTGVPKCRMGQRLDLFEAERFAMPLA